MSLAHCTSMACIWGGWRRSSSADTASVAGGVMFSSVTVASFEGAAEPGGEVYSSSVVTRKEKHCL